MSDVLNFFLNWDLKAFHVVNEVWANSFLDKVLPWTREKLLWIPLYILLAYVWIRKYKLKGLYLLLCLGFAVTLSDLISADIFKPYFHRLRPCQNLTTVLHLIRRIPCGSGYSFVSSHAANHFTIAAFTSIWFRLYRPGLEPFAYLWAAVICYAQVYVGVHYPLDVLTGAFLGVLIGWITGYFSVKYLEIKEV
jgi:membrane-associated phospholipid phosphatase